MVDIIKRFISDITLKNRKLDKKLIIIKNSFTEVYNILNKKNNKH